MGIHTQRKSSRAWKSIAAILLAFVSVTDALAQKALISTSYPDARVQLLVESVFDELPRSGRVPVRVEIENKENRAYDFAFSFDSSNYRYRSNHEFKSGFGLRVEAGKTAQAVFMVPLSPSSSPRGYGGGSSLSLRANASGLPPQGGSMSSNLDENYPCVALSTESARFNWNEVRNGISSSSSSGEFGSTFAPASLPGDWLGYSGFDALVISRAEWATVPASARKALLDWVRFGGQLVVWNQMEKPTLEALGLGGDSADFGLGSVVLVAGKSGGRQANPVSADDLRKRRGNNVDQQASQEYSGGWALQGAMGERSFRVGQIVLILILFAILVGPVNLFVLAKPGKRHRLFFTTPVISIGASLLLAALIFIQDGFGGSGMRNSVTLIDAENNQALTIQEQMARTGVLLSRSFEPDESALVQPVAMAQTRWTFVQNDYSAPSTSYSMGGKEMSGDFFRSRSEQGHLIRSVTATRERIEQSGTSADGAPEIISSIAHPLERLVYADADGKFWQAEDVGTGAKVTLKPWDANAAQGWWDDELSLSGTTLRNSARMLISGGRAKGRYFARVRTGGDDGFCVPTLASIDWDESRSLVVGKLVNAAASAPKP